MQRRISRYINSGLLKARLKLTGINSSLKNQERSRDSRYRFKIFPIVHFFGIARDTRAFTRGLPVRFPLSRARRNLAAILPRNRVSRIAFPPESRGDTKGRRRESEVRFGVSGSGISRFRRRGRRSGNGSASGSGITDISLLRIFFTK